MKKSILKLFALVLGSTSIFATDFTTDFKPFQFAGRPDSGTIADCSNMNVPITEKERISVGKDGHLYAGGKRIRIFGTNISSFPNVEDAEYWAKVIASQGYNCVRFHHTDSDWAECFFKHDAHWTTSTFDETAFERFDKFFYELKKAGVYSNINLLTGRTIRPDSQNKLPQELKQVKDWKDRHCYGFWNSLAREEQLEYAKKILNHKNPYTGLTYAEDPAVAFVEINNENSMVKCYFDGALERFPKTLTTELDFLWTDFLKKKGFDYKSLSKTYNQHESQSKNLLSGEPKLEQNGGAKADLSSKNNVSSIKVKANGKEGWHVQYSLYGFAAEADHLYTLSFKAKASKESSVDLSVMMNHDPWKNLGFHKKIQLTKNWQTFSINIPSLQADEKPRLTIGGMGKSAGTTFEFSDIELRKGGEFIFVEKSEKGSVKLPGKDIYNVLPADLKTFVTEFLVEVDSDYWGSMNDYLKNDMKIKALTFGTALPCAPVTVMAKIDVVDSHAYWNHPSFPSSSWNSKDYYVKNKSLTKAEDAGTLGSLANLRIYGKPFSVTEYDHPYPNQFSSEMMPMFSVFASLQDWDCIYSFCYEISQRNPDTAKITGYFDQANNPAKVAAVPVAARIFREFKIAPHAKGIYYTVSKEGELAAIGEKGNTWNNVPPTYFGIRPEDSVYYRTGAILQGDSAAKIDLLPVEKFHSELDAKQGSDDFVWDSKKGCFIFDGKEAFTSVTMPGSDARLGTSKCGFRFVPQDDFASVFGVKIDDSKWLVFSGSWSGNVGEKLREYGTDFTGKKGLTSSLTRDDVKLTTEYSGSGVVAAALGSNGTFIVENGNWKLYPLNQQGKRGNEIKDLRISQTDGTLWYVLEKE